MNCGMNYILSFYILQNKMIRLDKEIPIRTLELSVLLQFTQSGQTGTALLKILIK